jgi:hypothetical protein
MRIRIQFLTDEQVLTVQSYRTEITNKKISIRELSIKLGFTIGQIKCALYGKRSRALLPIKKDGLFRHDPNLATI